MNTPLINFAAHPDCILAEVTVRTQSTTRGSRQSTDAMIRKNSYLQGCYGP